ncbi:MAG TPA: ADP-ribosylglycohydrolase family protein, partial [Spirochaetia bacterium]|nr:ADP-ribosylglycohydrolase family protein [Spirochaetia bacterium]
VSHDGEAIFGAQVLAAMEAQAFVEGDVDRLLDVGLSVIPKTSTIYRMIGDIRGWNAADRDWMKTFRRIDERYGYDTYRGNCHIVPNHGVIVLGLLAGGGDFQRTLMIVNSCGLDTDCNSGNAGCLMGIKVGLAGINAGPDWRGPVADRLYVPTADGGRSVTDAVRETYHIANTGLALAGRPAIHPKDGAQFHFELPGSVQGFRVDPAIESRGTAVLENVSGHSRTGSRSLAVRYHGLASGRTARVSSATFIPPEAVDMAGYGLMASPTLFPTQRLRAEIQADGSNRAPVRCCLYVSVYGEKDRLELIRSPVTRLAPGRGEEIHWTVPSTGGRPIAEVGAEISGDGGAEGAVYLDYLRWTGTPSLELGRTPDGGTMWKRAWVNGADRHESYSEAFRIIQNEGRGLVMQGTRDWTDYRVSADITVCLARSAGIAARVQGMRRFYALVLDRGGTARLIRSLEGDTVLGEIPFPWEQGSTHRFELEVQGTVLRASVDGKELPPATDDGSPLVGGAIAFVCEEGWLSSNSIRVETVAEG